MAEIKGDEMYLQWLIVAAFRYAVPRHGTQSMYGIGDVILDNMGILRDEFIRQFIVDIKEQFDSERIAREVKEEYQKDFFKRLLGHTSDYIRYLKDERDPKAQELYKNLVVVQELAKEVKIKKVDTYKPSWLYDTSYLRPMYERLQEEYVKRGYKRIED